VVLFLAISIALAGSIGTSYALITHNDNVNINGNLQVIEGNLVVSKTGGGDSGLSVKNSGGSAVFQFNDVDDSQVYRFKLNKLGDSFQFIDASSARTDMTIKLNNGNIGIGTTNPQERLDINGNLRVQGNITTNGDICIGSCP
jgi:hypothetical protein